MNYRAPAKLIEQHLIPPRSKAMSTGEELQDSCGMLGTASELANANGEAHHAMPKTHLLRGQGRRA